MREVAFIKQNKEKWLTFEQSFFNRSQKDPEQLADLYIELVNDLAFAQTFYPKSKTVDYLNGLASKAYLSIYQSKRIEGNRVVNFFKTDVPLIAYQYRKHIYFSFAVFFLFVFIGALSAANDETYIRLILGDEYVNLTKENIKEGNPVAIYGDGSNWGSFIGITFNNIYVSMKCFVWGIFGGFGTGYLLMTNGIMLGSFQYMFYKEDVFWESVRGIWIHGAMEIFVIVISGACGFILGSHILFPKTYTRFQSFKRGFIKSFQLFVTTIPFFIAAGFLEGFVTRYSHSMPKFLSVGIILTTLFIVSFYYLIYPHIVYRKIKNTNAAIQIP